MELGLTSAARGEEETVRLAVRLLGPWDAQSHGQPLRPLRSRKGEWLLALLLLQNGGAVERDWLAGLLWPESDREKALFNLRRNLTDLRHALGSEAARLETPTLRRIRLDPTGADVDLHRFDQAIAGAGAAAGAKWVEEEVRASLHLAVRLYRGPLLVECHEAWVTPERTAREQAYVGALETLAQDARARGDLEEAARCLRRTLVVDPLREEAQYALMEALAAQGDALASTLVFREYSLLLRRELNAAPGPEISALFQQLRAQTRARAQRAASARRRFGAPTEAAGGLPPIHRPPRPPTLGGAHSAADAAAPPSRLPRPVSSFVGRDQEVAEVAAALAAARLVTLTGAGGAGKTRLAIRVGERLAFDYSDGVWFVDLAALPASARIPTGCGGEPPSLVTVTVARAVGLSEPSDRRLTQTLLALLRPRRVLLILDNCEHLLAACAQLAALLLESSPELRVLATSRQPLGLTGEVVWRVPSLSLPGDQAFGRSGVQEEADSDPERLNAWTPERLMQSEAVRLFIERGRAANREFALTAGNAAAVVAVCRRLDGLPLAIELAAARLQALTVEQIAGRLDDRFCLLNGGSRAALPRQQTLRATIDWSYALLDEAERALFRRLSVFAGSFTLEAAEAVGGRDEPDWLSVPPTPFAPAAEAVTDLLTQLVDKSLVIAEGASVWAVRCSGFGSAGPTPQHLTPNTEARYRLLETVRQYAREKLRESEEEQVAQHRHAVFYLRIAEDAAPLRQGPDMAVRLERLEAEQDNLRAALDWSLKTAESGPRLAVCPAKSGPQTDPPLPAPHCPPPTSVVELALRLAAALAGFWEERRHLAEGRQRLAAALERAERSGGGERRSLAGAAALEGASALALLQEDRGPARALLEESLAIRRELGDRTGLAASLAHLARLYYLRDDYPAARTLYEEALTLRRERGDPTGVAAVLTGLGNVARRQGQYQEAWSLHQESLAILRALGDGYGIARSLIGLGDAAIGQRDATTARAQYEEALALGTELGDRTGVAHTLGELANVCRQQGDYAGARRLRETSLALWRAVGCQDAVIHSLGALGHLAREQGDYQEARAFYEESLRLRQELGDPYTVAQSLEDFAELAGCEGQWRRVLRLLGAARALRDAIDKPLRPCEQADYDRLRAGARGVLGEEPAAAAWEAGQAMTKLLLRAGQWEPAITYALEC